MASEFAGQIDVHVRLRRLVTMAISQPWERCEVLLRNAIGNGDGANEARYFYASRRPIAALTGDDITLTSVTDRLSVSQSYTTIRALIVHNRSTGPGCVCRVSGSIMSFVAGDSAHSVLVQAGGSLVLLAPRDGYPVIETVSDSLSLDAPDQDIVVDLILLGT